MFIFKILQKFISPSIFIFLIYFFGVLVTRREKSKKFGLRILLVGWGLYYLFSITPIADLIIFPLENQHLAIENNQIISQVDTAVLLTGGENTRANEILRLNFYKQKLQTELKKIIITGTNATKPSDDSVAQDLKQFLELRGIKPKQIIIENQSRNTMESAQNVQKIVGQKPFFLVTSAYHMPRSMLAFQNVGTNPIPTPTDFKINEGYNLFDFFPSAGNLEKANLAFHEYFGISYYKLKYAFQN